MHGPDRRTKGLFSYVSCKSRVPAEHPLRLILRVADGALAALSADFQQLYALNGRPSIAPEKLLRVPATPLGDRPLDRWSASPQLGWLARYSVIARSTSSCTFSPCIAARTFSWR